MRNLSFIVYFSIIFSFQISCSSDTPIDLSNAPEITVIDTDFSKGKLIQTQRISLEDVAKFHGHLCDGLVVGYLGLNQALTELYPDGIVDRTNTRMVSKSSPCLTDVAIYISGGRYQYNTFYVDDEIPGFYIAQRMDNLKTVRINLQENVKPKAIDSLGNLAIQEALDPCEVQLLKEMEDDFSQFLLNQPAENLFSIEVLEDFEWEPILRNDFLKTDIINKNLDACK